MSKQKRALANVATNTQQGLPEANTLKRSRAASKDIYLPSGKRGKSTSVQTDATLTAPLPPTVFITWSGPSSWPALLADLPGTWRHKLCGADIFENVDAAPWTKSITSKIPLSLALEFLDCIVQPLSKILLKQWTSHRGFRSIAPHDTIYEYVFEKSMVLSLPFVSEDKENSPFLWILDAIERLRNPLISSLSTKWKYTDLYLLPQEWSAALSSIPLTALVVAFAIRCLYKKVWNVRKATLKNSTKLTVDIDDEEETTTQIDSLVDPKASEGHPADKYQLFDLSPRPKSQPQTPEHLQLSRTNAPLPNTQHNSFVTVPHAEISLLEQASPPALQVNTRVTASHSQISLPKQASPSSTNFAPQLNTGVMAASHSQINHPEQVSPSFTNFTPQTPQQYYSPSC